ncbi:unnamed protein product [Cyclocybe aegerita]|uniref:NACHT domain-containing protein n=1 Tax=Cyclocybe aegerita TaxID=1973307 RepID=A0A8S0VXG5_CYCAE|nr:unnamed protein product [Cyclocybe aegerita]
MPYLREYRLVASRSPISLASMNEPSSSAANKSEKKGGSKRQRFLRWLKKRLKSTKSSASHPNSTRVAASSAPGAREPAPSNQAENAEPPVSGSNNAQDQDHTASLLSARPPSSNTPVLPGSSMDQGYDGETTHPSTATAQPTLTNPEMLAPDWKETTKERLGVASRFTQTLLKKVASCVESNPVKVAFSIAKVIIEIKDAIGDNKDELAQRLGDTANRLLAVERTVVIGIPEVAKQAVEKLEKILGEEMKKLEVLAGQSLTRRVLDHEEDEKKIQRIFQCVETATTIFQVEMAISIQETASQIHDGVKKAALEHLRPSEKADHRTVLEEQALKREECTSGTRVEILGKITKWANDSSLESPRVFWLSGQAGSGKTTIAYTIAKWFDKDDDINQYTTFGGNFLCSRQFEETRQRTRIIPTIAYQLARKCRSFADALYIADKFNTINHDVSSQLKDLLVGPWQQSDPTRGQEVSPYLIVIDALDEIADGGGSAFLRDLLIAINKYDLTGFKFLVTSRPDPEVVTLCKSFTSEAICWLQDVPIEDAQLDIGTYLKTKLPLLASSQELVQLVQRSHGLFVYAATAVKYLTRDHRIAVEEQTEMLRDLLSNSYEPASASDVTFLIDELYRHVMHDAFSKYKGKYLTRRLCILYTFLCTAERTSTSVVANLVADGHDGTAKAVVESLHAVLYTQGDRIFWYHASFPDFIFNPTRAMFRLGEDNFNFWCNEAAHHNILGKSCFRVMKSNHGLRFNIGDIPSSFLFDSDNADRLSKVNQNISPVLRYSSCHWAHHLPSPKLINTDILCDCIKDFLEIRVLFWIEAMNLLGLRNQCTPMLQRAREWVLKCGESHSKLARDIGEAANFATYFTGSPAAESTPHLYISALATWLQDTSLCWNWQRKFSRIPTFTHTRGSTDLPLMTITAVSGVNAVAFSSDGMRIVSGSQDRSVRVWDASTGAELKVLNGHCNRVYSVAFSSDGTRVSGSSNNSVRVWDASTGAELRVLDGHSDWVRSVAFSSDGTRIVSGSEDKSVRIWDASTGAELKVLNGHSYWVRSVAFSSDGTRIVSGSSDKSVRVWDASMGAELKVLNGHTNWVESVAFSSDGTRIVSGSRDNSVRIWDASTGAELKVLNGHSDWVKSVAFSSDGTKIVSGSDDKSVRIWDASMGAELKVLNGHSDWVRSVAFSSDGTRIVSGSDDMSMRIWDASMGAELKVLNGHSNGVTSVVFSTDGTQIMSGSRDKSVRIWDASMGAELKVLNGHSDWVKSVAFSSDGTRIVSGSSDKSVRVWDASTGAELKVLNGHSDWVESVAFSSDGTRIVSGSRDNSVRIWDASTGAELKVLNGHSDWVKSVAFSSDGTKIVSGSETILDCVRSVTFSSDGTRIVSGSDDMSMRIWDASTGAQLKMFDGHNKRVNSVAFSSDGTRIVSGSWDKSVRVWDASTGAELKVFDDHNNQVNSVAFSSDGTRIVSGLEDESVRVWDVMTGLGLNTLHAAPTRSLNSVGFSSADTQVVSHLDEFLVPPTVPHNHCNWSLDKTNWLVSSPLHNRLMWVPPNANVKQPSNTVIISRHGFSTVDFRQSMIGAKWAGCYTP